MKFNDSDLKTFVIEKVDPNAYYSTLFEDWSPAIRSNVPCPFHTDRKPSMAVGLLGGGAKCHSAGCGIAFGNIVHFESRRLACSEQQAAVEIYDRHIRYVVRSDVLEAYQNNFLSASGRRLAATLLNDHGLTQDVTSHFGCGYDERSNRLVIPIYNVFGLVVNLRFYKPRKLRNGKEPTIYNYVTGKGTDEERRYGGNELFPWQSFEKFSDDRPVFIMASEKEAMLGYQLGLQAISSTAGEGSWLAGWSDSFVGFRIGILMDPDAAGATAATKLVRELSSVSAFSILLRLPFPRGFRGPQDLDDWVVHCSGTGENILALFNELCVAAGQSANTGKVPVRTSPRRTVKRLLHGGGATGTGNTGAQIIIQSKTTGPKTPPNYSDAKGSQGIRLDEIRRTPDALNRVVTSQGIVAGIAQRSFSIPWKFRIKPKQGPPKIWTITVSRDLLAFINAPDDKITKTVLGLCSTSGHSSVEPIEYHSVTELELIPLAASAVANNTDSSYTVQRCFAIGLTLQANLAYEFKMVPTTMPQSQETVGVIVEAIELNKQNEIVLDPTTIKRFELFHPEVSALSEKGIRDDSSVWRRLLNLATEVAEHHTHIYERPDWHMVVLLTFFSPLQFTWPLDGKMQRGWMNSLAIGDTKTGKSEVTNIVTSQLLQAGDIINSENCTYVGLVGGAIKSATGQFMLRWGRIPLCDRKLVVLEELSGLSVEEISNMSDVRSSGVARLDKGGLASQTPARTRLLCLSNVRSKTKRLADFLSGVKAVQELVGHAEDISRFDLIITLTDVEVSAETINRASTRRTTRPAWRLPDIRLLCQWVWSLRPDQIQISDEAVRRCLALTLELGKDYHSGIPIFKASSDRHKIARIAVSIACLQFSWNGSTIIVTPAHMEAATHLLRDLYDKPSLGYREWSKQMFDREELRDTDDLMAVFREIQPNSKLRSRSAEVMIHSAKFSRDELCATATLTISQADMFLGSMLRSRAIRKGEANVWEITPAGKRWLEEVANVTSHSESNTRFGQSPISSFQAAFNGSKSK